MTPNYVLFIDEFQLLRDKSNVLILNRNSNFDVQTQLLYVYLYVYKTTVIIANIIHGTSWQSDQVPEADMYVGFLQSYSYIHHINLI